MNTRVKKTYENLTLMCGVICTLLFFSGCQPNTLQQASDLSASHATISVPVLFRFNQAPLTCNQSIRLQSNAWSINKLAFFISDLAVKTASNDVWQSLPLSVSDWQTNNTALLWFNHECGNQNDANFNHQLAINTSKAMWQAATQVSFELAVPFIDNHTNPLIQASPLNIPDMFWSWQSGHKFVRIDLSTDANTPQSSWSYHLGSVGCESASSMRAPKHPCSMPNRFKITVNKSPNQAALFFDLAALLENIDPGTMRSCMFQKIEEVACIQLADNVLSGKVFGFSIVNSEMVQ